MKILHLTLKKKFFDMIASGLKKEEYRELKKYWGVRLTKLKNFEYIDGMEVHFLKKEVFFQEYDVIKFRNGYAKNAPEITVEFLGVDIGFAKPEWSDNWQGKVFIIKLGKILNQ